MQFLIILVLAFAPGIFWLWLIYKGDKYRPEPRPQIIRTFLLGIAVAIPVAIIEAILYPGTIETQQGLPLGTAAYVAFIVAGLTEETGKFLIVRRTIYNSPYFDEPVDGMVYSSAAALGFASLENLGYVLGLGWRIILVRGPISTVAHILFSAMWGYPIALNKLSGGKRPLVWAGLLGAIVAHGLFDFLLFSGGAYDLLVIPLFIGGVVLFILMFRHANRVSPYRDKV